MPPDPVLLRLFAGLALVLALATLAGEALRRLAPAGETATIRNLNARVRAWWAMVALMALALLGGRAALCALFAAGSAVALHEFAALSEPRPADRLVRALGLAVAIPAQYWLVWTGWYGLYAILLPVYGFLLAPILLALGGDTERFLARVAETQWGLMVCVYCISHVPALLLLEIPGYEGRGMLLVAFLVLVVQASDVLQYVWGKILGRRSIAPRLSPSKTVEGFVGGTLSATALGAALWWMTPFAPWQAGLLSAVAVLMGFGGGLAMSAIKRDRGVKDWGTLIPGHGGVLDRLDSVVFAAPVFFHLTRYVWSAT